MFEPVLPQQVADLRSYWIDRAGAHVGERVRNCSAQTAPIRVCRQRSAAAAAVDGLGAAGRFEEPLEVLAKYGLGVNSGYAILLKRFALSVEHLSIPAARKKR